MTHSMYHTTQVLTLALMLGLLSAPLSAQKAVDVAAASCSGTITPLQRELKKADRYLQRVPDGKAAQEVRSRLLYNTLQSDRVEEALARTLGCLMSTTRQME